VLFLKRIILFFYIYAKNLIFRKSIYLKSNNKK
jgi:hypothetical protein